MSSVRGFYRPAVTGIDEYVNKSLYGNSDQMVNDTNKKTIFIVHGHDPIRFELSHWLANHDLRHFFLDDKSNKSMTIIQKLEYYAPHAGFVIVLMTADDVGRERNDPNLTLRARQNVILELGYFIAKLGREKVHVAAHKNIEIPSDWSGVLNSEIINNKLDFETIRKDLKSAGFSLQY